MSDDTAMNERREEPAGGGPQEPVQELARQASDLRSGRGNVGRVLLKPEGRHRIAVSPEFLSVSTRLSREHIHQHDFREADLLVSIPKDCGVYEDCHSIDQLGLSG